jgi:hypothetical protein
MEANFIREDIKNAKLMSKSEKNKQFIFRESSTEISWVHSRHLPAPIFNEVITNTQINFHFTFNAKEQQRTAEKPSIIHAHFSLCVADLMLMISDRNERNCLI